MQILCVLFQVQFGWKTSPSAAVRAAAKRDEMKADGLVSCEEEEEVNNEAEEEERR